MAGEWRSSSWGEEISLEYGKALRNHEFSSGRFRVFGSNGPIGYTDHPLAPGPGVILGRKGAYRGVEYSPDPFFVIDTAYYVSPKTDLDMRWLYYAIKHHKLGQIDDGSPIPSTTRAAVYVRDLDVPPRAEQQAIAHILGTLDDKIELNRRMSATLEAMARALFKSWFVDFDPVRAKAAGRDPGLPKDLAALFPSRLVDSELGEIPEGWGVGCVEDQFDLTMGQSPPGNTYNETGDGTPFYQGRADFKFRFPERRVHCTAPTRFAKAGDALISVRAPVGDINMASEDCAIGRGVAAARHKTGSRSYTHYLMRGLDKEFSRFEAEGTVFGSINKKDFHAIRCVAVPSAAVHAFERACSPIDSRIEINENQSRTLAALRDTLLPKLISGQIRLNVR